MDGEQQSRQQVMPLGEAVMHYLAWLGGVFGVGWLGGVMDAEAFISLAILGYFAAGVYLNRVVLRRLIEWHPMYATLDNVVGAKLKMFFFWPISYLALFIQLVINEVL